MIGIGSVGIGITLRYILFFCEYLRIGLVGSSVGSDELVV